MLEFSSQQSANTDRQYLSYMCVIYIDDDVILFHFPIKQEIKIELSSSLTQCGGV